MTTIEMLYLYDALLLIVLGVLVYRDGRKSRETAKNSLIKNMRDETDA